MFLYLSFIHKADDLCSIHIFPLTLGLLPFAHLETIRYKYSNQSYMLLNKINNWEN